MHILPRPGPGEPSGFLVVPGRAEGVCGCGEAGTCCALRRFARERAAAAVDFRGSHYALRAPHLRTGATPKPQADPASTIYFTATRLRDELREGVESSLAVGATSKPLPATWEPANKRYQYQRMGLYKTKNPDGSRYMAVTIRFPPTSSSAAIGAAISSTQAYQNLDYAFKRAAKPAE